MGCSGSRAGGGLFGKKRTLQTYEVPAAALPYLLCRELTIGAIEREIKNIHESPEDEACLAVQMALSPHSPSHFVRVEHAIRCLEQRQCFGWSLGSLEVFPVESFVRHIVFTLARFESVKKGSTSRARLRRDALSYPSGDSGETANEIRAKAQSGAMHVDIAELFAGLTMLCSCPMQERMSMVLKLHNVVNVDEEGILRGSNTVSWRDLTSLLTSAMKTGFLILCASGIADMPPSLTGVTHIESPIFFASGKIIPSMRELHEASDDIAWQIQEILRGSPPLMSSDKVRAYSGKMQTGKRFDISNALAGTLRDAMTHISGNNISLDAAQCYRDFDVTFYNSVVVPFANYKHPANIGPACAIVFWKWAVSYLSCSHVFLQNRATLYLSNTSSNETEKMMNHYEHELGKVTGHSMMCKEDLRATEEKHPIVDGTIHLLVAKARAEFDKAERAVVNTVRLLHFSKIAHDIVIQNENERNMMAGSLQMHIGDGSQTHKRLYPGAFEDDTVVPPGCFSSFTADIPLFSNPKCNIWSAADHGDIVQLHYLLERGALADATDASFGRTALYYACQHNQIGAVFLLLEHQANAHPFFESSVNPLSITCSHGHLEICRLLIHQLPLQSLPSHHENEGKLMERSSAQLTIPGINVVSQIMNSTALHHAAAHGYGDVVSILLQSGADIGLEDANGSSALSIALKYERGEREKADRQQIKQQGAWFGDENDESGTQDESKSGFQKEELCESAEAEEEQEKSGEDDENDDSDGSEDENDNSKKRKCFKKVFPEPLRPPKDSCAQCNREKASHAIIRYIQTHGFKSSPHMQKMDLYKNVKSYNKAAKYFSRHRELILAFSDVKGNINTGVQDRDLDDVNAQGILIEDKQGTNRNPPLLLWSEDVGVWYVKDEEVLFNFAESLYDRHSRAKKLEKYMNMDVNDLSAFRGECTKMLNAAKFECIKRYLADLDLDSPDEKMKKQISAHYFFEDGGLSIELVMEFVKLMLQYTIHHSRKAESKRAKNRWLSLNNTKTKGFVGLASMANRKKAL